MDKPMTFQEKLCPRALLERAVAALAFDPDRSRVLALPPPRQEPDLAELFASGRMWG